MVKLTTFSSMAHSVPLRLLIQLLQEIVESHAWKRIPCPTNWSPGSKWDFTTGISAVNWEGKYPRPSSTQACFLSYDSHSKCRKFQVEESQGMCPERNHACDISPTLPLLPNVHNIVWLTGALFFLSGLIFDNYQLSAKITNYHNIQMINSNR